MDKLDLSILNSFKLPRGAQHHAEIKNHCDMPWTSLSVNLEGDCFLCRCDAHLPISVGKITNFSKLEDVWNNSKAKQLQQTIINKTFDYCAVTHCGIINQSLLANEYYISINIDESCNLACPTCRRDAINHTKGPLFERRLEQVTHFVKLINQFDKNVYLTMTGNGDPLASLIMRPLILNWNPLKNQRIQLFTNGLLMSKLLPNSSILANIQDFKISIDAGSKEVYEVVRAPGKFNILIDNLTWLKEQNKKVRLMFTLSSVNANDIINFADLCSYYGFDGEITKLEDWQTFDDFASHDVVDNPQHPLYNTAVTQLKTTQSYTNIILAPTIKQIL